MRIHVVQALRREILTPGWRVGIRTSRVVNYTHRERVNKVCETKTDSPQPEDGDGLRGGVVRGFEAEFPILGEYVTFRSRKLTEAGDDQIKRGRCSRIVNSARRIRDDNAYGIELDAEPRL